MRVMKLEVMVIDFEDEGPESIVLQLEDLKYISSHVMSVESVDIGNEWSDDHPLNDTTKQKNKYNELFSKLERKPKFKKGDLVENTAEDGIVYEVHEVQWYEDGTFDYLVEGGAELDEDILILCVEGA